MKAFRTVPPLYGQETGFAVAEIDHRPELVEVVAQKRPRRRKTVTLVTPFAGKWYCLPDYLRGVGRLPGRQVHAVWYDNSNDRAGGVRLQRRLERLFDSYTLIRDTNPAFTIESSTDYPRINARIAAIYDYIARHCLGETPLALFVEDDVEIPARGFERLKGALDAAPRLAAVAGNQVSRRLADCARQSPIVWDIERTIPAGAARLRLVPPQQFGVQLVGASHTGCVLARAAVVRDLGFRPHEDGIHAVDAVLGYRINKLGRWYAVDWSVRCKHYFLEAGRKTYVA